MICDLAVLIGPSVPPTRCRDHPQAAWAAASMNLSCLIKGHDRLQAVILMRPYLEAGWNPGPEEQLREPRQGLPRESLVGLDLNGSQIQKTQSCAVGRP